MQTHKITLTLDEVAGMLCMSPARFRRIRRRLEAAGFPPSLPACGPRWSGTAVLDWIRTAGGTAPAGASIDDSDPETAFEASRERIEAGFTLIDGGRP